jgi:hypothetical protein
MSYCSTVIFRMTSALRKLISCSMQALAYVLTNSGGGYIGEYIGSFSAFASNDDGRNPIGLINGNSGVSG